MGMMAELADLCDILTNVARPRRGDRLGGLVN
jgi:hypothetical protein